MDESLVKVVFLILGLLLSFLSALSILLVRQALGAVKELRTGLHELTTKAAVGEERHAHLTGSMSSLHTSVARVTKDVGKLSASIDKVWAVMEAAKLSHRRLSDDQLTGTED